MKVVNKLQLFGVNIWVLLLGLVCYVLVIWWQGWIGFILFTLGQVSIIINRVLLKMESGYYDDDNQWREK